MDSKMENLLNKIGFNKELYSNFESSEITKIIVNKDHTKFNIFFSVDILSKNLVRRKNVFD